MSASTRSVVRYWPRPSAPPNPPTRTCTACAAGAVVRPASETVTATSARSARCSARRRASVVPPRMRMRRMSFGDSLARETAAPPRWLSIVGIGEDGIEGLTPIARSLVQAAEMVFGGQRHLVLAAPLIRGVARPWRSPFERAVEEVLAQRGGQVCVLASGDPFVYGVGSVLLRHVDPRETVTVPALSTFSLAAARLGWALPETTQLSLHGRALDLVRPHLQPGARVLALTSDGEGPAAVARLLADTGFGTSRMTVLEALGGPQERLRATTAGSTSLRSKSRPRRARACSREHPVYPTSSSSTTARSPSARSAR